MTENLLDVAVETVDGVLGDVIGVKPANAVKKVAKVVAPANAIRDITGIPKPDEVLAPIQSRIESDIKSKGRGIPRPPVPF